MAKRGDIEGLPVRAEQASRAVGRLSGAFAELSTRGTITNQTLTGTITALGVLGGPVGLAAAGAMNALAGSLAAVANSGIENITNQFRSFATAMRTQAEFAAKAAGENKALADNYRALGSVEVRLQREQERLNEVVKKAGEQVGDELSVWNLVTNGFDEAADATRNLTAETRAQILARRAAIEGLLIEKKALETSTEGMRRTKAEFLAFNVALEMLEPPSQLFLRLSLQKAQALKAEEDNLKRLITEKERDRDVTAEVAAQREKDIAASRARAASLQREISVMEDVEVIAKDAIAGTVVGAFDAYANALDKTVSLNNLASESFGRAMQNMAASTVRSVGQQAAIKAGYALAEGFFLLANKDFQGAKDSFQAAAIYTAVAAAAGVGAGLLSVNPGGKGGGGGRSDRDFGGGKTGNTVNVVVIGALDHQSRRDLARQLKDEMDEGDL